VQDTKSTMNKIVNGDLSAQEIQDAINLNEARTLDGIRAEIDDRHTRMGVASKPTLADLEKQLDAYDKAVGGMTGDKLNGLKKMSRKTDAQYIPAALEEWKNMTVEAGFAVDRFKKDMVAVNDTQRPVPPLDPEKEYQWAKQDPNSYIHKMANGELN